MMIIIAMIFVDNDIKPI